MKKTAKKHDKGYLTFDDVRALGKGTGDDAEDLLDAVREHRDEQRRLHKGRRARAIRS